MDTLTPRTDWQEQVTPGEDERFAGYARDIQEIQRRRAEGGVVRRGFHAKIVASVRGEFTVLPDLPTHARAGLFAAPATYPAWVRFSNGDSARHMDRRPDVRGLAIKVLDVPGVKIIPGLEKARTQDFLLIQTPAMPFHDPDEFMFFVKAASQPLTLLPRLFFRFGLGRGLGILRAFARGAGRPVASLAGLPFYTPAPIQYGDYAVRYSVVPAAPLVPPPQLGDGPDYLGDDLALRLSRAALAFDFRVQFYVDPQRTPIEDTAVEWREVDTPALTVARLVLPQQDLRAEAGQRQSAYVDSLSFDPWHARVEHRPLGAMMRARKHAYLASILVRQAAAEPTGLVVP